MAQLPEGIEITTVLYFTDGELNAVVKMAGKRDDDLSSLHKADFAEIMSSLKKTFDGGKGWRLMTSAEVKEYKEEHKDED